MIIAIDGFSACGKSTLAKNLASKIGYGYIDTGAMYRCCTLIMISNGLSIFQELELKKQILQSKIDFKSINGENVTFLNNKNVEKEIRSVEVNRWVSEIAALSMVRKLMVEKQREMAKEGNYILDGRDIGTVVFPDAPLKLFVTASHEIRVERRWNELQQKGMEVDKTEIAKNLKKRDFIDSNREDSPLRQADDAILLDNSEMTREEQLDWVTERFKKVNA